MKLTMRVSVQGIMRSVTAAVQASLLRPESRPCGGGATGCSSERCPPPAGLHTTHHNGADQNTHASTSTQPACLHCRSTDYLQPCTMQKFTPKTTHLVPKGIENSAARLQARHDCPVQRAGVQPAGAVGWSSLHLVTPVGVRGCRGAVGVVPAGAAPPDCGVVAVTGGPLDHHLAAAGRQQLWHQKQGSSCCKVVREMCTMLSVPSSHTLKCHLAAGQQEKAVPVKEYAGKHLAEVNQRVTAAAAEHVSAGR